MQVGATSPGKGHYQEIGHVGKVVINTFALRGSPSHAVIGSVLTFSIISVPMRWDLIDRRIPPSWEVDGSVFLSGLYILAAGEPNCT